ncbi:MAG: hypothetical protein LAN70_12265 [Acidobacteriia bacterium]|nr:hypothetical protein [Terriglobia bacterium]
MTLDEKREAERQRLERLRERRPTTDDFPGTGVVLSDGIESYCKQFDLISPFNKTNLKPAYYKLSVGDQYAIGGDRKKLPDKDGNEELDIPPFEVAIIKTLETINMPRFLIGRWNIQVPRAYEGLLWVGGPQVDPGYVGHLFCPIYNLSDQLVRLRYRDTIAVIDFVKTTEFHEGNSLAYKAKTELILFEDYPALQSALVTQVDAQIKAFQTDVGKFQAAITELQTNTSASIRRVEDRAAQTSTIIYTAVAIMFAAVAIIATSQFQKAVTVWTFGAFLVSVLAVIVAFIAFFFRGR